jgi:hypothetical protein
MLIQQAPDQRGRRLRLADGDRMYPEPATPGRRRKSTETFAPAAAILRRPDAAPEEAEEYQWQGKIEQQSIEIAHVETSGYVDRKPRRHWGNAHGPLLLTTQLR